MLQDRVTEVAAIVTREMASRVQVIDKFDEEETPIDSF
jgi:hypothetical protein